MIPKPLLTAMMALMAMNGIKSSIWKAYINTQKRNKAKHARRQTHDQSYVCIVQPTNGNRNYLQNIW